MKPKGEKEASARKAASKAKSEAVSPPVSKTRRGKRLTEATETAPKSNKAMAAPRVRRSPSPREVDPLRLAFLTSEMAPWAKEGGLGDVSFSLPRALQALGAEVRVFLPHYRAVARAGVESEPAQPREVTVTLGSRPFRFEVRRARAPDGGAPVWLFANAELFDREGIYNDPETAEGYFDNGGRFLLFTKAVIVWLARSGWIPRILHTHDFPTALAPAFVRYGGPEMEPLRAARNLLTLHNLAHQGSYGHDLYALSGLPADRFYPTSPLEFYGRFNFLKAGIDLADRLTTVSPRYARDITTDPNIGHGLTDVLRHHQGKLSGILNGIDTETWNPAADRHLAARYTAQDLSGKATCKRALLTELGLGLPPDRPLLGFIGRLVEQKGIDLIAEMADRVIEAGAGLVILGKGQPGYERRLTELAGRHPESVAVRLEYSEPLAHRIEAGLDVFLMPSIYEPCGLTQMYSMRYGTLPIVRDTGGLADSVRDFHGELGRGTGFKFGPSEPQALLECVQRALGVFSEDRPAWTAAMQRAMAENFGWDASAQRYLGLCRRMTE